jgi:hypothetical protein
MTFPFGTFGEKTQDPSAHTADTSRMRVVLGMVMLASLRT